MDIGILVIWWNKMKDRDKLRTEKLLKRDNKLRALYRTYPELKIIDRNLSAQILKISRLLIEKSASIEEEKLKLEALRLEQESYLLQHDIDRVIYEPDWDCKKCKDLGYIEAGLPCECFREENLKERKLDSNIPEALFEKTFENFDESYYEDINEIKDKVSELKAFSNSLREGKSQNFILTGEVGRGKTHLALACANLALEQGYSVYYVSANELVDEIRTKKYNENSDLSFKDIYKKYLSPDLLIIDDLGIENATDFSLVQLTALIDERNLVKKPWIITLNYSINNLEERYDSRFVDRLLENTRVFQIKGNKSIRLLKRRAQL